MGIAAGGVGEARARTTVVLVKVHFVVHEDFEGPAAIEHWATGRNFDVSYSRVYLGERLPSDPFFDLLVVMGGPQSPDTTVEECSHFDAAKETALIRRAIDSNKYVIGVCLGAQLIGEALGAKYDHSPNKEIGAFPIALTEAGRRDLLVSSFPDPAIVGHWHGDMPGLTDVAEVLAMSEGCPRQIVRYTRKVYGFQCHLELTLAAVEGLIANSVEELASLAGSPYVESPEQLRSHSYDEMNALLHNFLDDFTSEVGSNESMSALSD